MTKTTVEPGDGTNFPKKGDMLTMHYRGTLVSDGSEFDASYKRGKPFQVHLLRCPSRPPRPLLRVP